MSGDPTPRQGDPTAPFITYKRVRDGQEQIVTRRRRAGERPGYSKKDPIYVVWAGMRYRCNSPSASNYKYYGAKGVSVCSEWDDFFVFREWALTNGYAPGLELDREHSDKNYCPSNCRVITKKANIRNRDLSWSNKTDAVLIRRARELDVSPYELIRIAVEEYLLQPADVRR